MSKDNAKNLCAYITLSSSLTSVVSDGNFARCIWFCSIAGTSERLAMDG